MNKYDFGKEYEKIETDDNALYDMFEVLRLDYRIPKHRTDEIYDKSLRNERQTALYWVQYRNSNVWYKKLWRFLSRRGR